MKAPLGLLLAVLVLGGCAEQDQIPENPGQSGSGTPSAAPSDSSVSLPPHLPKTTKAEPPVDDFQQVTAQAKVRVSGKCTELVTDQITWTLVGPAAASLRDGQQAKVVGVPDPNRETGCTGSPLLVSQAMPM